MPHQRKRDFFKDILATLKWSPAVGIVGLRQVGKTTLAKSVVAQLNGKYVTFDEELALNLSRERPEEFLTSSHLLCLDEVQRAPWLFPKIKDLIGTERKPKQFLLTGSVRFTLKKEVKESLTGRIIIYELLPFTLAEASQEKAPLFLDNLFQLHESARDLRIFHKKFEQLIAKYQRISTVKIAKHVLCGGLPIPCFTRDDDQRKRWFQLYYESLITRDLALYDERLRNVTYRQGMAVLYELAQMQQQELNVSKLTKTSGLSRPMLALLLMGLEALCLIDLIPAEQHKVKSIKKLQIQWKDTGLWSALTQIPANQIENNNTAINLLLSTEFRAQIQKLSGPVLWHYYRHRDGAHIPWIFKKGQATLVLTYLAVETPQIHDYRVLQSYTKEHPHALAIILTAEKTTPRVIDRNTVIVPYHMVFK